MKRKNDLSLKGAFFRLKSSHISTPTQISIPTRVTTQNRNEKSELLTNEAKHRPEYDQKYRSNRAC